MTPKERSVEVASEVKVTGSAYAELNLSGRWALSIVTDGWSDQEKQALLDGDKEAKDALLDALTRRIIEQPDDFSTDVFHMTIERGGQHD